MKITEVVAALIWDGDKFLICQRPAHKARGLLWEFVGGKVESGETKEQALVRECKEELDILLSVGDVFMDLRKNGTYKSLQYDDAYITVNLLYRTVWGQNESIRKRSLRALGRYRRLPRARAENKELYKREVV